MKPRLIAIDLDATLLGSTGRLSERNAAALQEATKAGILVVPATARPYQPAHALFARAGLDVGAVASAGADVRLPGGVVVEQRPLPGEFIPVIAGICDAAGGLALFSTPNRMIRRSSDPPNPAAPEWAATVPSLAGVAIETLLSVVAELPEAGPHHEALAAWSARLTMHRALRYNGGELLTVTAAGVDKGSALLALCKATGIDLCDTVAIGDSAVDLPIFAVVGHAVAMANASSDVKAVAAEITASADEDGVALFIERVLA